MPKWAIATLLIAALIITGFLQYVYMPITSYEFYNGLSMPILDMDQITQQTTNKFNLLGNNFVTFLKNMGVIPEQYVLTLFTYNTTVNQKAYLLVYMPPDYAEKWTNGTLNPFEEVMYWNHGYRIYAFKDIEGYQIRDNQIAGADYKMVSHMTYWINERTLQMKYIIPMSNFGGNIGNGMFIMYNKAEANEITRIDIPSNNIELATYTNELNYTYRPLQDPENKDENAQPYEIQFMLESVEIYDGSQYIADFTLVKPY